MKELRDKLKNELKGLDRKTINLKLLSILNIFIILRYIQERKKKRKRIIKDLKKLQILFENYILNLIVLSFNI